MHTNLRTQEETFKCNSATRKFQTNQLSRLSNTEFPCKEGFWPSSVSRARLSNNFLCEHDKNLGSVKDKHKNYRLHLVLHLDLFQSRDT